MPTTFDHYVSSVLIYFDSFNPLRLFPSFHLYSFASIYWPTPCPHLPTPNHPTTSTGARRRWSQLRRVRLSSQTIITHPLLLLQCHLLRDQQIWLLALWGNIEWLLQFLI
ncbi:hypothetical protein CDL12_12034 [Handroanthus impetiginosus]|uniref:Uncharacterized protein n=1 Tax=Handroanthus impetiginosus TaxID=429701 RepID=A0A2G9HCU4_9LAMI|nr:hypothetical protein CDL12_12034 [Handroanthus impetiginosus]